MPFRTLRAASARASRSVSCARAGSAAQMRAACFSSSATSAAEASCAAVRRSCAIAAPLLLVLERRKER